MVHHGLQPLDDLGTHRFRPEHLDVIVDARELCERRYAEDPADPGMAALAAPFTGGNRIDYLDKA